MLVDRDGLDNLLVDLFLESQAEAPEEIWLDLDATDDPTHGQQEGRFYHGYYREHCYLPLYIFCERTTRCARGWGRRTGTPPTAAWRIWSASWDGSGSAAGALAGDPRRSASRPREDGHLFAPHCGTDQILGLEPAGDQRSPMATRIRIRADAGFCRDGILSWCEANELPCYLSSGFPAGNGSRATFAVLEGTEVVTGRRPRQARRRECGRERRKS